MSKDIDLRDDSAAAKSKIRVRLDAGRQIKHVNGYLCTRMIGSHATVEAQMGSTQPVFLTQ